MKITFEGKEFEFSCYGNPREGEDYITPQGSLAKAYADIGGILIIVKPVEVLHTFGGVEFRETGENRVASRGEWFWYATQVNYVNYTPPGFPVAILEPVRIVKED